MICHSSNTDIYYDLLNKFKRAFAKGGKTRQKFTYPSLIFSYIRLSVTVNHKEVHGIPNEEVKYENEEEAEPMPSVKVDQKRIYKAIAELILTLQGNYPELALRLNLQAVQAINNV